jgi:hypothetical protein
MTDYEISRLIVEHEITKLAREWGCGYYDVVERLLAGAVPDDAEVDAVLAELPS